jgi:hypothetical protein
MYMAVALTMAAAAVLAACGGGGGKDKTATPAAKSTASGPSTGPGGSPAATTSGTPGATATPLPTVSDADASATAVASIATETALAGQDITGGDENAPREIVSTIPAVEPRSGTTPVIDPAEIAPPNVDTGEISFIVDMDASTPGIQSGRDVNVSDVFQVGIVLTNIPPNQNNLGGLASFNFQLNYDKTKIVAPTYAGGPVTGRNPQLNLTDLGGPDNGWQCLPAPEGDLDDPGGLGGDGTPETGQAFLSCFTAGAVSSSGTLVLATVSFTAIAKGTTQLTLSDVAAADGVSVEFAHCPGDSPNAIVPCQAGTADVR